jgi:hypothetical protein
LVVKVPNHRSRLFLYMARHHATLSARIEAMRGEAGVDWSVLLGEFRQAGLVPEGYTRNAAQKTWERVNETEAWKRYAKAGSGVQVVEHSSLPLNQPAAPAAKAEDEDDAGEDAVTRMLIQRRGEY